MFCVLKRFLKYFLYVVSAAAIVAAGFIIYLIWFQPSFYFPKPTGQYAVGCKDYHWVDTSRKETLADDPAHPYRELMVTMWFPAQGNLPEKPATPYVPYNVDYFKKAYASGLMGKWSYRSAYCYAQPENPIISDGSRYPVIIFSHGFSCTGKSNTAHCEELASHGYVVVGISHTYDSCVVKFPDGRIADVTEPYGNRINDQEIEIWVSDVQFVLNQLEQLDSDQASPFYKRLDKKNIGMFGHSFGGATAVQICLRDARVKAGVNMDSSLFGVDATKGFDKPFMSMLGGDSVKIFERPWTRDDWNIFGVNSPEEEVATKARYLPAIKQLSQAIGHDAYTFVVKDAWHMDFYDSAFGIRFASPVGRILVKFGAGNAFTVGLGSINGFRSTEIVNAYLVNFFDKYLKGKPSELLDGDDKKYPEVEKISKI